MSTSTDLRRAVLITAAELTELMHTKAAELVLLDVRWSLAQPDGRRHFVAGHIPGAQYVDLEADLSGSAVGGGRHPLPDIEELQAAARRWGVDDGDDVVVYDDSGGTAAARAWWLLRWGGMRSVRILDGGLQAWRDGGGILEDGSVALAAGNVTLSPGHMPVTDADGAARFAHDGVLLDARATERYAGQVEPIDPKAGHIPGARSAPTSENLDADNHFLAPDDMTDHFRDVGVDSGSDVAVYCGSGITAAHEVAALCTIGVQATLFPGSWSQWSTEDNRPVATGLEPG